MTALTIALLLWVMLSQLCVSIAQSPTVVGAAFTMSNLLTGNSIVVSSLDATGNLTYAATVPTGGLGSAVLGAAVGTLGNLYSQDSLVVDQTRGLLFAVNAGSNSVSMFAVSPTQPTQITLVATQTTGFDFPVSIALSTNRSLACVLNGGANNGIRCYSYSTSALTTISSFDTSLGLTNIVLPEPDSPFNTTGDISFTADSLALLVTVRSNGVDSGSLYIYPIDYATSSLSAAPVTSILPASMLPFSLSLVGSDAVLVTEPLLGSVSVVRYDSSTGATDAATVTPFAIPVSTGFGALCWVRHSTATGNYLLIGAGLNGTIVEVSVDPQTLQTTYVGLIGTQPFAEALDNAIATINGQDYLYVIEPATQAIQGFQLSGGAITSVSVVPLPDLTAAMVGLAVYTVAPSIGSGVLGDPQFVGLLGQSYQVHGIDNQVYNLIYDAGVRVNSRFTFLSAGRCPAWSLSSRGCWSHPGSYLGAIGVVTASKDALVVLSGPVDIGFTSVTLQSQVLLPSTAIVRSGAISVRYIDRFTIWLSVGNFELTVENSDGFVNLVDVKVRRWDQLRSAHGLLGQTWNRARARGAEVKEVEGVVDDYAELDNDLLGSNFAFVHKRQADE